jgi:hypothetical protein
VGAVSRAQGPGYHFTLIDRQASGRKLEVNIELQEDFSLHQTLSLYMIDTLEQLDLEDPEYVLQVLSLCEAIVEDPDVILYRQIDKLKEIKIREMKEAGIEYEERMERLQEIEHPKPMREFLYDSFNEFKRAHPWVDEENVKPKRIAREVFEEYLGFGEYVNRYKLQRSEGVLLRHLSQVYKVLTQTVPEAKKTDDVWDAEDFLFEMIRGTDSSLLDEWERLRNPNYEAVDRSDKPERTQSYDLTRDKAAFQRAIRTEIFTLLKSVSSGAAGEDLLAKFDEFHEARERFLLDPEARNAKHTYIDEEAEAGAFLVAQVLVDPEGFNDWEARFRVNIDSSREAQAVVMELGEVAPVQG